MWPSAQSLDCDGHEISDRKVAKGRHLQKLFAAGYGSLDSFANEQHIGNMSEFVQYWVSEELQAVEPRQCMEVVEIPSRRTKYIQLKPGWFS